MELVTKYRGLHSHGSHYLLGEWLQDMSWKEETTWDQYRKPHEKKTFGIFILLVDNCFRKWGSKKHIFD